MMGKRYLTASGKVENNKNYGIDEAFGLLPETACASFDETVELTGRLGVDPRHADQQVRGAVLLPNGTGREVRVLVFAKGEKETEAKEAGADHVGAEELVDKIQGGWLEFDSVVATPDIMGLVSKLGRVLGPRGLMPNPKLGTVTFDVKKAVTELKAGKVEFRVDKVGNIHVPIGKVSFGPDRLRENFMALLETLVKAKPAASKGMYLRSLNICTTMGPGIKLDTNEARNSIK